VVIKLFYFWQILGLLTALLAKKHGIDKENVESALNEADHNILLEDGNLFEKQLSNV
jgi:hypothetical protein